MEWLKIIVLVIGAAIVFGILHDQVTARICVEYFTIGHPPVFQTDSPTLLGLGWGIIATWLVGLILGIPIACCSRAGSRPVMNASDLIRPVSVLLGCMGCLCLIAGISGYYAANSGTVWLLEPMRSRIPAEKHVFFIADLWSHLMAYASGFFGGIILCVWIFRKRGRLVTRTSTSP